MAVAQHPETAASAIPIIDFQPALACDPGARRRAAIELRAACRSTGFFYASGHGIPPETAAAQLDWTRRAFALDDDAKATADLRCSPCRRGFEPLATQVLDPGTPPDLKESFYVGRDLGPDHPYVAAGLPNHGANQWPQGLPGFREHTEDYFARLSALALELMRLLALSLELPEGYFGPMMAEPMPILRLIHYPPHPSAQDFNRMRAGAHTDWGAGAHTDWGALTLLLQDDVGGLEVQDATGAWIAAVPVPGTFVVNLGDMIARWTNGQYRSNRHRVRSTARDRYSVVYFSNPDPNARIECLPTCIEPGRAPRFAPCTAGEHIDEMYRLTFGDRAALAA